jgi:hypothetical protein
VGVFLPAKVNKYYKLSELEFRLNTDFMVNFYVDHEISKLVASWWKEDRKFINRTSGWYGTKNIREPY